MPEDAVGHVRQSRQSSGGIWTRWTTTSTNQKVIESDEQGLIRCMNNRSNHSLSQYLLSSSPISLSALTFQCPFPSSPSTDQLGPTTLISSSAPFFRFLPPPCLSSPIAQNLPLPDPSPPPPPPTNPRAFGNSTGIRPPPPPSTVELLDVLATMDPRRTSLPLLVGV